MAKKKARNIDVHIKWSTSGWVSTTSGRPKAPRVFSTQSEAVSAAKRFAARDGAEVIVHDREGKIRDAMSFNRFEGTRTVKDTVVSSKKSKMAFKRAAARAHSK
jgi:hypothetical protein